MINNSRIITDQDIQALIDNELGWEAEKHVREAIKNNPNFAKRYDVLKNQKTLIQNWWKKKIN